ncbi:MAG: ABC transporter ATP-binding protein [Ilumatobacteraceae bacterium]|nr:ABC transporter ATP-binding protein [Ilumatobacteraceae bacterium]
MTALLEVRSVAVRFGGVMALSGVDLDVQEATITGLIGPNGAGKTTLFNVICGIRQPTSGVIMLDDIEINRIATQKRSALGIGRTFQRLELFTTLSVFDNVLVAAELAGVNDPRAVAHEQLLLLGLADRADIIAGELPTGSARLLEVARALASHPRLLLLDEPASGLDDAETQQLSVLLRQLKSLGITVLLVEHDMSLIMSVCDQIHVLNLGSVIASGTPDQIQHNPEVIDAYLGAVR